MHTPKQTRKSPRATETSQHTAPVPEPQKVTPELDLARALGNQAYGRFLQAKLTVQRQRAAETITPPVQRQMEEPIKEEEDRQMKADPAVLQRQEMEEEEEEPLQGKFTVGETPAQLQASGGEGGNRTGLPQSLKTGLEVLSGIDLSGIRVHNNSYKPAQLNALAFTQGQDIHVGPGQGKHLPHEGWHAVQQMQGRVKPTMQAKRVSINDDVGLEREADVMGTKASSMTRAPIEQRRRRDLGSSLSDAHAAVQRQDYGGAESRPISAPVARVATRRLRPLAKAVTRQERRSNSASIVFDRATKGAGGEVPYRAEMEKKFNASFANTQAHFGKSQLQAAGANAAAKGETIAFASSSPTESQVGHELTHVIQQRKSSILAEAASRDVSDKNDAAEREADAVAAGIAQHGMAGPSVRVNAAPTARVHLDRGNRRQSHVRTSRRSKPTKAQTTVRKYTSGLLKELVITTELSLAPFFNSDAGTNFRFTATRTFRFRVLNWRTTFTTKGVADFLFDKPPGDLAALIHKPAVTAGHSGVGEMFGQPLNLSGKYKPGQPLAATVRHRPLYSYSSTPAQRWEALFKLGPKKFREKVASEELAKWLRIIKTYRWYRKLERYIRQKKSGADPNEDTLRGARSLLRRLQKIRVASEHQRQLKSDLYRRFRRAYLKAKNAKGPNKSVLAHVGDAGVALGKAVKGLVEGSVELAKTIADAGRLGVAAFGQWTGWFKYDPKPWSAYGKAAARGKTAYQILKAAYDHEVDRMAKAIEHAVNGDYSKAFEILAEVVVDFVTGAALKPAKVAKGAKAVVGAGEASKKAARASAVRDKLARTKERIARNRTSRAAARARTRDALKSLRSISRSRLGAGFGLLTDRVVYKGVVNLAISLVRTGAWSVEQFILELNRRRLGAKSGKLLSAAEEALAAKAFREAEAYAKRHPPSAPASPVLKGSPYHPDSVAGRTKPPYKANLAHDPKSKLFDARKTPEPADAAEVYTSAVRGGRKTWYGLSPDQKIYRYFTDARGTVHFSGIVRSNEVPIDVRRILGVKTKGR